MKRIACIHAFVIRQAERVSQAATVGGEQVEHSRVGHAGRSRVGQPGRSHGRQAGRAKTRLARGTKNGRPVAGILVIFMVLKLGQLVVAY